MTAIPYPAHSELKGHFSEDPAGTGTRALAPLAPTEDLCATAG